MNNCKDCTFYRKPNQIESLKKENIAHQSSEISNVFDDLIHQVISMKGQEAFEKVANAGRGIWAKKPQTFSYCGFSEDNGIYHLHEVKNLGGRCADFSSAQGHAAKTCQSCQYCKTPSGHAKKVANMEFLMDNIPSSPKIREIKHEISSLIANEIRLSFFNNGRLSTEPFILKFCSFFSRPEDSSYVICALENSNNTCQNWKPK